MRFRALYHTSRPFMEAVGAVVSGLTTALERPVSLVEVITLPDFGQCIVLRFEMSEGEVTLWDFEKVMRHSLAQSLAELRRRLPCHQTEDLTIDRLIEIRNDVAAGLRGKATNLEEIRLQAFRCTVELAGGGDLELAADLNSLYVKHRSNQPPSDRPVQDAARAAAGSGAQRPTVLRVSASIAPHLGESSTAVRPRWDLATQPQLPCGDRGV